MKKKLLWILLAAAVVWAAAMLWQKRFSPTKSLFKFQFDNLLSMIFEKAIWIMASEDSE